MKGDGEGKMNAVEKQGIVHVCSRPAIVVSSQSLTLLGRIFPLDFNSQFIHISPARDIVNDFSSGAPLGQLSVPAFTEIAPWPTSAKAVSSSISCAGEPLYSPRNS